MSNSPITNRNCQIQTMRLPTREVRIFQGHQGGWYNHHQQITSVGQRLFATWSSADTNEDEPGQHMMLATSDDKGETWSTPRTLVAAPKGEHDYAVLTSMGIHVHQGLLVAYCGSYEYTKNGLACYRGDGCNRKGRPNEPFHQNSHCKILVSRDLGKTWQQEGQIERFVPNLRPQPLRDGRLIMPGNMWFPYTDDPAGITGWKIAGIPRLQKDYVDDSDGFWRGRRHRGDSHACCEGSFYQTDDGVVHMMLRTEEGWLAVCESTDRGVTYSEPMRTDYSDSNCRFHFGRLPSGRWFGLSCPNLHHQNDREATLGRTPMVLAVSDDGIVFDRHYVLGDEPYAQPSNSGFHKHGRYGYPSYHIDGDTLWVIYSVHKQDIACMRCSINAFR